jgi:lipoprotein-anchoring transpeptidase ErfK/SrfK
MTLRPRLPLNTAAVLVTALLLVPDAAQARETYPVDPSLEAGTIIVRTRERRLYLITEQGSAIRYPVAVGKASRQWFGEEVIDGKHLNPGWIPPQEMRKARPKIEAFVPGGSPRNPMGAAALTLSGDKYAIHGTNQPKSIGLPASFGCIRMRNEDILDLYERVKIGTRVVVAK